MEYIIIYHISQQPKFVGVVLLVIIGTVKMLLTNSLLGGKYRLQQLLLSPQAS
jgi:hypothetical protein